ncbi:MAG TPA: hypothetical protein VE173_01475, partial [Longimicrobiales bacterium]|nr:hypothetical protein [Longimicrobiales bacterium]
GRWEIVFPGEEPPTSQDLLTEATLPAELRGTQKRYTELSRFNVFLPPTGEFVLEGPDPETLPTDLDGLHLVLLRIEATADKEADSDLGAAAAGTGVLHSGAVAGFPIPPLRYYVGSAPPLGQSAEGLVALFPEEGAIVGPEERLVFSWTPGSAVVLYRLEVEASSGERALVALVQPGAETYLAPPWLRDRVGNGEARWRVAALGPRGETIGVTAWRTLRFGPVDSPAETGG